MVPPVGGNNFGITPPIVNGEPLGRERVKTDVKTAFVRVNKQ